MQTVAPPACNETQWAAVLPLSSFYTVSDKGSKRGKTHATTIMRTGHSGFSSKYDIISISLFVLMSRCYAHNIHHVFHLYKYLKTSLYFYCGEWCCVIWEQTEGGEATKFGYCSKLAVFHCGTAACWHRGGIIGHFIPLNLTSVAIFSPARSNMSSLMWQAELNGVKGASSPFYKVVASGPCFLQGRSAGRQQQG